MMHDNDNFTFCQCHACNNMREKYLEVALESKTDARHAGLCVDKKNGNTVSSCDDLTLLCRGPKDDHGKDDWHCVPLVLVKLLVPVFESGAKKYWRFSCLEQFEEANQRFFGAQLRHLEPCQIDPLAVDEDTGCFHQAQVAFNALMRLHHALNEDKA